MAFGKKRSKNGPSPSLVTELDPKSAASEAFRTLRTNIHFAALDQAYKTIAVTSSSPSEGKTTTAANLAVATAQAGSRVCLVDADLRRPAIHRMFGLANTQGLTAALLDGLPFAKVAQSSRVPNLSVLTSGPLPPNPAELVGSKRMREMLEQATAEFDLVICDTPPVISVTDGVALGAQCDGVILVVRVGTVPQAVVRRAAEQIQAVNGKIIGVLLNSVNLKRDAYYYDYYRYYRAYYGDDKKR
jgi:capsular exopolysaccharide synthesis family protein